MRDLLKKAIGQFFNMFIAVQTVGYCVPFSRLNMHILGCCCLINITALLVVECFHYVFALYCLNIINIHFKGHAKLYLKNGFVYSNVICILS